MHNPSAPQEVIKLGWFYKLVIKSLPDHVKRKLIIGSLIGIRHADKEENKQLMHSANMLLHLSGDERALGFPIQVSSHIWQNTSPIDISLTALEQHVLNETELKRCARNVVDHIPSYFLYDDPEVVADDICLLFSNRQTA